MINYWQQEEGKLVKLNEEDLDRRKTTWIDARNVTRDDIEILETKFDIDKDTIIDILDPDELARIEQIEEKNQTLTLIKLPVFSPNSDIQYFTAPVGVITKDKTIVTICWTDSEVLKDFSTNRVANLALKDSTAFTIRIMARADWTFLRYLKEINRRATTIQNEMFAAVENKEFVQLLNLQKSLVFFSTSLKSNQLLLEKIRKSKILRLDEEDQDWLDDVEIDSKQAMEMADTYMNIMSQMNDAFASVLSNNLNIIMKKMTLISLVLMIPTFITSFWGMNIPLPWMNSGWLGMVAISCICLGTGLIGWWMLMGSTKTAQRAKQKKKNFKQYKAEKKQKKLIQIAEKKAEKINQKHIKN